MPTADNLEDCASRGLLPLDLLHHSSEGPLWLHQEPPNYPEQPLTPPPVLPEVRAVCHAAMPSPPQLWLEERYSSYHKLLRVMAWCQRFIHNLKALKNNVKQFLTPCLTTTEVKTAEVFLFTMSQQRWFAEERTRMSAGKSLKPSSSLLCLNPTIGSGGLLRVGGRLANAAFSFSQQHPVILHGKDHLTALFTRSLHIYLLNAGPTLLMSSVGAVLHVVGAKRLIRSICRSCVMCKKVTATTQHQMMGQLPHQRVTASPPFHRTGMDFAGPFTLRKGHTRRPVLIKAYVCIFVCFATKAAYIELVSDLTSEAFLAAL